MGNIESYISFAGLAHWRSQSTNAISELLQYAPQFPLPGKVTGAWKESGLTTDAEFILCYAFDIYRRGWQYLLDSKKAEPTTIYYPHPVRNDALDSLKGQWQAQDIEQYEVSFGRYFLELIMEPEYLATGELDPERVVNFLLPLRESVLKIDRTRTLDPKYLKHKFQEAAKEAKLPLLKPRIDGSDPMVLGQISQRIERLPLSEIIGKRAENNQYSASKGVVPQYVYRGLFQDTKGNARGTTQRDDQCKRLALAHSFDVFLSHNSNDKPTVRELKERLAARNLKVWLDQDELQPGIPWMQLLEDGIKSSASVAVLVGEDGLGPWEDEEMQGALRLAVKNKRPVIPVLLPGAPNQHELPLFLGNRTWVDLRDGFTAAGIDKLIWGITGKKS
jgi:hypothetical protein